MLSAEDCDIMYGNPVVAVLAEKVRNLGMSPVLPLFLMFGRRNKCGYVANIGMEMCRVACLGTSGVLVK